MQHNKHARKSPLQSHHELFSTYGGVNTTA